MHGLIRKLWDLYDATENIWVCKYKLLDVGTLVFDGGKFHSRKLIPSYKNGKFVCRENENKDFVVSVEMRNDLDLFWEFSEILTTEKHNGEDFSVPDTNTYGIEYFLNQIDGETNSCMENVLITDNIITLSGYGWGQQRHNVNTPAAIKSWGYRNTAKDFFISNNIFDRCAYRLLHLVALKNEFCPVLNGNTYIQTANYPLGQYGGNEDGEPEIRMLDINGKVFVKDIFGDEKAVVILY